MIHVNILLGSNCLGYIDPKAGGWLFQLLFPLFVAIGGVWMFLRKKAWVLCSKLPDGALKSVESLRSAQFDALTSHGL